MLGVKQEALAIDLNVSQQNVSNMEAREQLDDELMEKVAGALGIKPELVKNFVPEDMIYNIQNDFDGSNSGVSNVAVQNYNCSFNPLEIIVEAMEANKKSYDRLLHVGKEKNQLLQKLTGQTHPN